MRELPKDVLKMAFGLISLSGLAGHCRPLCNVHLLEGDAGHFCLLLSPDPMVSRSVAEARVNTESDPHPESPEVVASSVPVSSDMPPQNIFEEVLNIFVALAGGLQQTGSGVRARGHVRPGTAVEMER